MDDYGLYVDYNLINLINIYYGIHLIIDNYIYIYG